MQEIMLRITFLTSGKWSVILFGGMIIDSYHNMTEISVFRYYRTGLKTVIKFPLGVMSFKSSKSFRAACLDLVTSACWRFSPFRIFRSSFLLIRQSCKKLLDSKMLLLPRINAENHPSLKKTLIIAIFIWMASLQSEPY